MKKILKRVLSTATAATLLIGFLPFQNPVFHSVSVPTSITVNAATSTICNSGKTLEEAQNIGWSFQGDVGNNSHLNYNVTMYQPKTQEYTVSIVGASIDPADSSLTIPSTATSNGITFKVTEIADSAFENQTNLKSTYGGGNLAIIGNSAFKNCSALTDCNIINGRSSVTLESIGESAFEDCSSLERCGYFGAIYAKSIAENAFNRCSKLVAIDLKYTNSLGKNAFSGCYNATSIRLKNQYSSSESCTLTTIPSGAFSGCSKVTEVSLPESVTKIDTQAFVACSSLEQIYFPKNVKTIGNCAFGYCSSLKTVMLPQAIQTIGDQAFDICSNLKYIVCKNPNAQLGYHFAGFRYGSGGKSQTISGFTIWGKGGTIKTYANNNGFTYHDVSEAPALAKEAYKNHMWGLNNTQYNWGTPNSNYFYRYYVPEAYAKYDTASTKHSTEEFGGICYGLSSLSALSRNGVFHINTLANGLFQNLKDVTRGSAMTTDSKYHLVAKEEFKPVQAFATAAWMSCNTYNYDYSMNYTKKLDDEYIAYMEHITYGADTGVLSFELPDQNMGHAVSCFGVEFKENASDKNNSVWGNYDARMLIYDCNTTYFQSGYCIYFNTATGEWKHAYSGYNISTSHCGYLKLTYHADKMYTNDFYTNEIR